MVTAAHDETAGRASTVGRGRPAPRTRVSGHSVAARAAAVVVAAIAGAASWSHIASVAAAAGEAVWVAWSLPLAVDGLVVVGVAALLEDRRAGRIPRASARVAVAVGVAATLAANVASAEPTWTARAVAVAAPVSFLLSVEVLTRSGRPRPAERAAAVSRAAGVVGSTGGRRRGRGDAAARVAAAVAANPGASVSALARAAEVARSTVRRHVYGSGAWVATRAQDDGGDRGS